MQNNQKISSSSFGLRHFDFAFLARSKRRAVVVVVEVVVGGGVFVKDEEKLL